MIKQIKFLSALSAIVLRCIPKCCLKSSLRYADKVQKVRFIVKSMIPCYNKVKKSRLFLSYYVIVGVFDKLNLIFEFDTTN